MIFFKFIKILSLEIFLPNFSVLFSNSTSKTETIFKLLFAVDKVISLLIFLKLGLSKTAFNSKNLFEKSFDKVLSVSLFEKARPNNLLKF